MAKKDKRFIKIYEQGSLSNYEILVDKVTGVNYLYASQGYSGGITPLLDRNGNVVISALPIDEKQD